MRLKRKIALLLCMALLLTLAVTTAQGAAVLKVGSQGEDVKTLQNKLKRWGYYYGAVDGIFGGQTRSAVKYFQQANGLAADGVVGPATAKALGMQLSGGGSSGSSGGGSSGSTNSRDVDLLARVVNGEARGEPYKGQVAVAAVILNRVKHPDFPNSISGVVYQSGAFDAVADGQVNLQPADSCVRAAKDAINGYDPTNGCIYYYNPQTATNQWIRSRPIVLTIGKHVFAK